MIQSLVLSAFLAIFTGLVLAGCTTMSEEDKALWNDNTTNSPAAHR
jgi:hypothetical protein